jgi:DNA-binding beta-propeller fold protein YncE
VTAPADPRLGTRLAGYRIQALLGQGGMGVVYLAEQLGPRRPVALKLLSAPVAGGAGFRERFLRESELAAAIDHPNVLPVYDAGETDGVLWIAMRHVDGLDLGALLAREGPLVPQLALAIGGQVADALDTAHARGLVHRDVKPGNVLLAMEEGGSVTHAWLADFGLTRRIGGARRLTVSGQVLGTIDYVAPEQVEGGQVDGRADQYALGCVLFECLTGVVPFRRDSELAVLWAHVNDPPPGIGEYRPDLPAAVDDVIGRALAKAPGDRHPSCAALVTAAEAALAGSAPAAVRPRVGRPAGRRTGRGRRRRPGPAGLVRRPVVLLAATVVVLVAVVVAAILVARDGRAPAGPAAPTPMAAADHAVRIDPATYEPVAAVPVRTDPAAVVGGGGLVWVANRQDGTVTVVDPGADRVQETLPASGSGPVGEGGPGLAFASGSLWIANTDQQQVTRVEPDADPIPIRVNARPHALAAAPDADAVWVAAGTKSGGGLLARIDAGTNQLGRPISLPHAPTGLAITLDGRTVWVATAGDKAIRGIDTRPGGAVRRITLPLVPDQVAVGDGAVWVTSSKGDGDAVLRIDPVTSRVVETIRVGNGPSGIAFGAGRVWVANGQDGTVSAIDPQSNEVGTRHLGFRPAAVAAVDQGAVWVALAA